MIVEFSVKNFRSIKELQTLSFVTTGLKSAEKYTYIDKNNIVSEGQMDLFKTIGIYGSNASGKSNIIKALDYFIKAIKNQPSSESNLSTLAEPFLYQSSPEKSESFFQIVMIIRNVKYRYGITVKKNPKKDTLSKASGEIVTNEWLIANKVKNMTTLFEREGENVQKNNLANKGNIPTVLPYAHSLFLTHAAAFDKDGDCKIITDYLRAVTTSNFEIDHEKYRRMSIRYLERKEQSAKSAFLTLLSSFNLKYDDVLLSKDINWDTVDAYPQDKISLIKKMKLEDTEKDIVLNLKNNESAGSQKMFDLAGLLLVVFNFPQSAFIILDEIDSNFHPALLIKLVSLFNDPSINKSKSQLLFTSHDTNLMSPSIMRRDQFYFTEKNEDESTRLYSLADLKGIKNDADFAKQYLAGYYGALPVLGKYSLNIAE